MCLVGCLTDHVTGSGVSCNDVETAGSVRNCRNAHLGGVLPDDLGYFTKGMVSDLVILSCVVLR